VNWEAYIQQATSPFSYKFSNAKKSYFNYVCKTNAALFQKFVHSGTPGFIGKAFDWYTWSRCHLLIWKKKLLVLHELWSTQKKYALLLEYIWTWSQFSNELKKIWAKGSTHNHSCTEATECKKATSFSCKFVQKKRFAWVKFTSKFCYREQTAQRGSHASKRQRCWRFSLGDDHIFDLLVNFLLNHKQEVNTLIAAPHGVYWLYFKTFFNWYTMCIPKGRGNQLVQCLWIKTAALCEMNNPLNEITAGFINFRKAPQHFWFDAYFIIGCLKWSCLRWIFRDGMNYYQFF